MRIHPGFIGIDISKQALDIFDGAVGKPERIANRPEAIGAVVERWRGSDALVLFEATGPYDRHVRCALSQAGVRFSRVNPARARDFARACGALAKTDAIDARMLAAMAQALTPATQENASPERDKLTALHRRRDQLVDCRKRERTRRATCGDGDVLADLDQHIAWLDARIAAIEDRIRHMMRHAPQINAAQRLLRSIPGVGPVAATTLIALMPELGARTPKTIAALAGLAPFNVDSGQFRGKRAIKGGRRRVRQALYMAAVAAAHSKFRFASAYKAMIDAGKPAKLALIAIARKILVTANAVMRDKIPFKTA